MESKTPEKYGTMILFGAKPPHKADPRFPVPVTLCGGSEEIEYISRAEHEGALEAARAEARIDGLRSALRIAEKCEGSSYRAVEKILIALKVVIQAEDAASGQAGKEKEVD